MALRLGVLCHEGWFLPRVRETGWFGGFAIFFRTRAGRRGRAIIEEKPPNAPRPGCHPYGITNFGQEPKVCRFARKVCRFTSKLTSCTLCRSAEAFLGSPLKTGLGSHRI